MLPTRNTITTVMIRPETMVPDKLSSGFFMAIPPFGCHHEVANASQLYQKVLL